MGVIYLLHFARSYGHARHYLGYTENLDVRLAAHRAHRGSPPLVAAAVADGIEFELAATWPGGRHRERRFHRYNNTPGGCAQSATQTITTRQPRLSRPWLIASTSSWSRRSQS